MRRFMIWFMPLGTAAIICMGCYTVLVHPRTEENYSSHDYQQGCTDCHSTYHEYPYGYFYGNYPDYWWDSPRYGRYYAYPWWWDYYWYTEKPRRQSITDGGEDAAEVRSDGKKIERRQSLRPPYSDGIPTISRDDYNSGGSSGSTGSSGSAGGNTGSTTGPASSQPSKEKEEEKKTPRRDTGRKR